MRGFTLVELVVVAGIIAIVSAVLVVGQSSFSRTILLTNTASDIALSLRNAQVFGISNRSSGATSNANYGISFTTGASFIFFADTHPAATCSKPTCKAGNGYYTAASDSLTQTLALNNGMTVSNFCAVVGATSYCKLGGTNSGMDTLAIVFGRPNTIASTTVKMGSNVYYGTAASTPFTSACIEISSQQATKRVIKVTQFGEIIVSGSTGTCP